MITIFENFQKNNFKDYQKYFDKYVILEYKDTLCLAKIIDFATNEWYVKIEEYEWDDFYKGYNVNHMRIHLNSFTILESFDNIKDAEKELKKYEDAKKYNL